MRVAINGFGRIGRLVLRQLLQREEVQIVAINDLQSLDQLSYFFQFDTVHGRAPHSVEIKDNALHIDGRKIEVFSQSDPSKLPWGALDIDYVVEASGRFKTSEQASFHLTAGAKSVIVTAPSPDLPTFVMGVNEENYNSQKDKAVSNGSCTTNCLAPIAKLLDSHYGIEEGLMTTIHAATASQNVVDCAGAKDKRLSRSILGNIIPSSTGAATAVARCLPSLEGKLTGMAFRVPVADVSVVDLTCRLKQSASYDEICRLVKKESEGPLKGILHYCETPLVSSDFVGSTYSSIFDSLAGIALNDRFFKLILWYDNEMGYSARVVDLMLHMDSKKN